MAKSLSWLLMLPLMLEMRTSTMHITTSYSVIENICPHDISIALTDSNAMIASSSCNTLEQSCITGNTCINHITNDNREHLLLLCHSTGFCVVDTWFPRKSIHHWTWYSSDGTTKKAIDLILISKCWQTCINDCRVYRGAQLGNIDHWLLITNIKI